MTDALRDGCYCTDEGPCESHVEVLCAREGASLHTADELCAIFIGDAIDMMDPDNAATAGYVTDEDRVLFASVVGPIRETADEYWAATDNRGGWCDDADLSQALYDDAFLLETYLPFYVWWDDGYVVGRISGGPLADEDDDDDAPLVVKCGMCWRADVVYRPSCGVDDNGEPWQAPYDPATGEAHYCAGVSYR